MTARTYLDWNATAPLRPEAREAMLEAMDLAGNPSSVHAEGRKAKGMLERARAQVAELAGVEPNEVIFTSGATEAATLACAGRKLACADIEHDAVFAHQSNSLSTQKNGEVAESLIDGDMLAIQAANSETGVLQNNFGHAQRAWATGAMVLVDAVQAAAKVRFSLADLGADFLLLSGHKIGGPKGTGALCLKLGVDVTAGIPGGGQEQGRRSGTENLIGAVGFGAAAASALDDQEKGVWDDVATLRDAFEERILNDAPDAIIVGQTAPRLPNTSCIAVPGWKGETQVMQMDLAGFAISAGSACSSGKVKKSRVLSAMGFDDVTAASAIRVSIGPTTHKNDLMRFADTWVSHYIKHKARAA
ncbi:MAG: cysteine desulfurase family protein [Pseudomonadota bacterium]